MDDREDDKAYTVRAVDERYAFEEAEGLALWMPGLRDDAEWEDIIWSMEGVAF